MIECLLTEHQLRDMLIECRSSVKFDLNQMELAAMKSGISEWARSATDNEANRLRLLLDRIDAMMEAETERVNFAAGFDVMRGCK